MTMAVQGNKELMQTLDDAWNNQDWDTFEARHAEKTVVHWPGQPDPTRGMHDHRAESIAFFQMFDNHLDNRPYKVLADGDWTCSIARWTGTRRWKNGQIVDENLFYDQVSLMPRSESASKAAPVAGARPANPGRRSPFTIHNGFQ